MNCSIQIVYAHTVILLILYVQYEVFDVTLCFMTFAIQHADKPKYMMPMLYFTVTQVTMPLLLFADIIILFQRLHITL